MLWGGDSPHEDTPLWLDRCPVSVVVLLWIAVAALALRAFDHASTWL